MYVDADAEHYFVGWAIGLCRSLSKNAAGFARTDEEIVGPAQVDDEAGDGANCLGSGEACGERQKRQARGGNLRPEKNADVEPFAGDRDPTVIAATAPGQLLIGEIDRTMRATIARGGDGIGVCRAGDAGKVQLAGKESAGEIGIEGDREARRLAEQIERACRAAV